ncbi:MAG: IPT/TIG domain-containing protein [Candidatus Schekmanbacteria bacterium]|nr:IPT/TIG domain-containing protein [Candidatus Schekmanbacteria bacterium]
MLKRHRLWLIGFFILALSIPAYMVFSAGKPKVVTVTPSAGSLGKTVKIKIKGSNFTKTKGNNILNVEFNDSQLVVNSIKYKSSKLIEASVIIGPEATLGKKKIIVTNPNGKKYTKAGAFNVKSATVEIEDFTGSYVSIHNSTSQSYRNDCTNFACHFSIMTEKSLKASVPTFHMKKLSLPAIPGATKTVKCTYCHKTTDIVEGSAKNIRRNVDVELCVTCHKTKTYAKFYME